MNSRKMESAGTPAAGTPAAGTPADACGSVEATLRSLVKRPGLGPPRRLLEIGWSGAAVTPLAGEVVSACGPEAGGEGGFDAILWAAEAESMDRGALAPARRLLTDRGRLVLRGSAAHGTPDAAVARRLVRALSEAGFVVVKEIAPEELGGRGGAVVVARRDDFVIRPFADGDEEAIGELFAASFHAERSREHWRWKYHASPYGNRYVSLAFSPEGELAAHYAGYPMPFWRGGRSLTGLHMGDTMTAPRFRRIGRGTSSLLARTVRHFFAIHRQGPFAFFYGFNTGGIQRFCRWFIGGSQVEAVHHRVREPHHLPPPRSYRVTRVTRLDASWDRFFRRVAPAYGFLVRRDAQYVDWRYLRSPDEVPFVILAAWRWRRLAGWSVFRRREDRLLWGDALFHPRHVRAAEAVLASALMAPELAGAGTVEGWFPDRPRWWHAELARLGFESRPHPDGLGFMYLPDGNEEEPLDRLYYTMGDGDLF